MKKWISLFLCLLALLPAARAERVSALPPLLEMTQVAAAREYVREDVYVRSTYPATANAQVDGEMRALIDAMTEKGRAYLPAGATRLMPAYLDTGASVYRTGEKWMSFLTIARVAYEREQTYVDFDARAYDMETGKQLKLSNIFPADSPAWALLEDAVRTQLSAYFAGVSPDAEALNALCAREALENAAFTLSAAKLSLHYRADALYPGTHTLMHVMLYYPEIRPYMTETAQKQTDNSAYKLIALTYDDGGARGSSMNVMDQLRLYGADATFFVVGTNIVSNHDVLCREHDAGYAVESHNYEHVYNGLTEEKLFAWRARFDRDLNAVIGKTAAYMRAPGGQYRRYIQAGIGLPLIQWSVISGDADNKNVASIAATVINNARDGAVVLMHDLNPLSSQYTQLILPELTKRGYLCVTVDELFAHYGVPLQENTLYYSCEEEARLLP